MPLGCRAAICVMCGERRMIACHTAQGTAFITYAMHHTIMIPAAIYRELVEEAERTGEPLTQLVSAWWRERELTALAAASTWLWLRRLEPALLYDDPPELDLPQISRG